jgi:hypothetical protein
MVKPLQTTMFMALVAGGLAVGSAAFAQPPPSGRSTTNGDINEPRATFSAERECRDFDGWVMPFKDGDWDEPRPLYGAARDCVAANAAPADPSVARDADPTEPRPQGRRY